MCLLMIMIVETKVTQNKSPVIVKRAVSFSAPHSKIKRKNCQMLKSCISDLKKRCSDLEKDAETKGPR